jgi:hypothetical protein
LKREREGKERKGEEMGGKVRKRKEKGERGIVFETPYAGLDRKKGKRKRKKKKEKRRKRKESGKRRESRWFCFLYWHNSCSNMLTIPIAD